MARHRRRRRRRFGDPVISMPSFGAAREYNPLGKSVNSTDVLVGGVIGLAGGSLLVGLKNRFWPAAPAVATQYGIPVFAAGLTAHMLTRKKSPSRAEGYFVGAVAAALIPQVWDAIRPSLLSTGFFGDPVIAMPSYGSFLTRSPGPLAGLLTASPGPVLASSSPVRRAMGF